MNHPVESLKALFPFVKYYQCLGILPISLLPNFLGLQVKSINPLRFLSAISVTIQVSMISKGIYEFIQSFDSPKPADKVGAIHSLIYFIHIFLMTLLMLRSVKWLPGLIEAFKRAEQMCRRYSPISKQDRLVYHCWIIYGSFFCAQTFGNILYFYAESVKNNVTSPQEFSSEFSIDKLEDPIGFLGYVICISEFYCDCLWIFGDACTALLAFILTAYFLRLNKGISESGARGLQEIETLRMDHRVLRDLVQECNRVFSPIILTNYIGNIGYLLTRLYTGVGVDLAHPHVIVRVESIYALVYQFTKILVPTWFAASLNEAAHSSLDTIHNWPSSSMPMIPGESQERLMVINRFVGQLVSDPVGLSGRGYFTISKSFMVTLISVLITFEVVVLQFHQGGLK